MQIITILIHFIQILTLWVFKKICVKQFPFFFLVAVGITYNEPCITFLKVFGQQNLKFKLSINKSKNFKIL
jgi:hypothetical protein